VTVLQNTAEEKDLGIWMDSSLKFSIHVAHAAANANGILGLIRSFVYLDTAMMKLRGSLLYTFQLVNI